MSRDLFGSTHPAFRVVLIVCLATFILVPVIISKYPVPDVYGGWCQSGGRPAHYRVETVAKALLFLDGAAAIALIAAAAILTTRFVWVFTAILTGVIAFWVAFFVWADTIDCAFY